MFESDGRIGSLRDAFKFRIADGIQDYCTHHEKQKEYKNMPEFDFSFLFHAIRGIVIRGTDLHIEFKPFTAGTGIHKGKSKGDPGYHRNPEFKEGSNREFLPCSQ